MAGAEKTREDAGGCSEEFGKALLACPPSLYFHDRGECPASPHFPFRLSSGSSPYPEEKFSSLEKSEVFPLR